jgi:hypothetical protein
MALIYHGGGFAQDNLLLDFAQDDMDLLSLVASLALEDVDDLHASAKGKTRFGAPPTDAEVAMRLYAEEAASLLAFSKDAALARSMDSALDTDRGVLAQVLGEELSARHDREVAVALSEGRQPPPRQAAGGQATRRTTNEPSSSRSALAYAPFWNLPIPLVLTPSLHSIEGSSWMVPEVNEEIPEDIYVR